MPGKIVSQLLLSVASLVFALNAHGESKRYLVHFKDSAMYFATSQSVAAFKSPLETNGSAVAGTEAKLLGTDASVTQSLNNLHMMVVESNNPSAIQALKNHPAIAIVEEEIIHDAPKPISTKNGITIQRRRGGDFADDQGAVQTTVPTPWGITAVKAPQAWSVTRGSGARVMVLDTGVDQNHPALLGQIEAVQNFTTFDATDVTDDVGHGTHVSGTILASGNGGGLIGVAPDAKLLMGKVCTPAGCSSVAIASGLDWAVQEHVDVVSMSLGGDMVSDGEALAVQAAEAAGVMVIAASGNDSKMKVSYPGAMPSVLAVGAVDSSLNKADFSNWGPELGIVGPGVDVVSSVPRGTGREASVSIDGAAVTSVTFSGTPAALVATDEIVFANLGKPEDFTGMNLQGKFALIQRGEIPFKDKVTNAIAAGAAGVIIYNNTAGMIAGTVAAEGQQVAIPVVGVEPTVGESMKAKLLSGVAMTVAMGVLKTDYASFQGTSMATPHVSGVAALVRAANHSLTPAQVRDILKGTATPLSPNDQNQFGSGMVNAEAAVNRATSTAASFLRVAI